MKTPPRVLEDVADHDAKSNRFMIMYNRFMRLYRETYRGELSVHVEFIQEPKP